MKRILIVLLITFSLVSCKEEVLDHVKLTGQLTGLEANDTLMQVNSKTYNKDIKLDADGNFADTLHIKEAGFYTVRIGKRVHFAPFLAVGNNLTINGDLKDVENTLNYKGKGEDTNNYLVTRRKEVKEFTENFNTLAALDSTDFEKDLNDFNDKMSALLDNKKLDTSVVSKERMGLEGFIKNVRGKYVQQHAFLSTFVKGTEAPKFSNYENYKGGTTSLDDFKGKYVFIDVWATWCKPCLVQIPALKELEEAYKDKNIAFVSISTDKEEKIDTWKTMIKEREMSGMQLYAGEDIQFMQAYQISSIPRFIFIDPEGNIVNADAPKPTDTEAIAKMFSEEGL